MNDLTGKKFGRLSVIEIDGKRYKNIIWKCICDCGNVVAVSGNSLTRGFTKSCGCLHKEIVSERNRKDTKYRIDGDMVVCYTSKGEEFCIDVEDVEKVCDKSWWLDHNGHFETTDRKTKKKILLHRFVLGLNDFDGVEVDHIDRNPANNRKSNLRLCSSKENQRNIGVRVNNTSGITGVAFDKKRNKWKARITVDGKERFLGRFDTIDQAANARLEAEKEYFGEFAPQAYLPDELNCSIGRKL